MEKTGSLPVFKDKVRVQDALKKEAARGDLTYTLIHTGPFLDWAITVGVILNLKAKSVDLYDGGDRFFSTTTLPTIAKAVTGVLTHLEQTKNRTVYVQDTATKLNKLTDLGKKVTGADGWKETVVPINDLLEQGWAELRKEEPNPANFVLKFLIASIFGEGYGGHFQKLDNELLGIEQKTDAELQSLLESLAK